MNIGEKLRTLRDFYGYNQVEIAEKTGTTQRNVSYYEATNEVTGLLDYIIKFCSCINIPVSDFFIEDINELKRELPDYITPEDAALIKLINTAVETDIQLEIKKSFTHIVRAILINKADKLKHLPEYKALFGEE